MIGVICPSVFEYRALHKLLLNKKGVRVILSGMGKVRALDACHELYRAGNLKSILLVGFAGALTSTLKIGDVIEPSLFIEQDYNAEPFEKFPNQVFKKKKLLADSIDAVILTQDRFLKESPYKTSVSHQKYKRLACDMESYAVAWFCRKRKIPYAVIKLISDVADDTADHDFLKACRELAPKLNQTALEAIRRAKTT